MIEKLLNVIGLLLTTGALGWVTAWAIYTVVRPVKERRKTR
jgi:hypothetical protein